METKIKQAHLSSGSQKQKAFSALQEFKEELKKVSWTTKSELIFCTKIVLIATFVFGLGIYIVDLLIKGILDGLRTIIFFIFG